MVLQNYDFLFHLFLVITHGTNFTNGDCFLMNHGAASYSGKTSVTASGRTCQRWDANYPHVPNYPMTSEHANYCRSPDGDSRLWCYTMDPMKRWEYCDVCALTTTIPTTTTTTIPTTTTPTTTKTTATTAHTTTSTTTTTTATTTITTLQTTTTLTTSAMTTTSATTTATMSHLTSKTMSSFSSISETNGKTTISQDSSSNLITQTLTLPTPNTDICMCPCNSRRKFWLDFYYGNYTEENKSAILEAEKQKIRSELLIDKTLLKSYILSRTSAEDDRPTAKSVGYVGVVLLTVICVLFPSIDLLNLIILLTTKG